MDFPPFAFIVNEAGLPEIATEYTFAGKSKVQTFSYSELSPEQHRQALEMAFANGAIKGVRTVRTASREPMPPVGSHMATAR